MCNSSFRLWAAGVLLSIFTVNIVACGVKKNHQKLGASLVLWTFKKMLFFFFLQNFRIMTDRNNQSDKNSSWCLAPPHACIKHLYYCVFSHLCSDLHIPCLSFTAACFSSLSLFPTPAVSGIEKPKPHIMIQLSCFSCWVEYVFYSLACWINTKLNKHGIVSWWFVTVL